jgi:stage III sporulation protein AF
MDALRELVRSLAIIIILTSFLELILPNSKMRNYVRLILGLFVIVIILNPILSFLGTADEFSAQAWVESSQNQGLDKILDQAQEMSANSQRSVLKDYTAKVEQQIAAVVKLTPEISKAEVEVELKQENSQNTSGEIDTVIINAQVKKSSASDAHTAEEKDGFSEEPKELERRIQSIVSDFYGLMPQQVSVKLKD